MYGVSGVDYRLVVADQDDTVPLEKTKGRWCLVCCKIYGVPNTVKEWSQLQEP